MALNETLGTVDGEIVAMMEAIEADDPDRKAGAVLQSLHAARLKIQFLLNPLVNTDKDNGRPFVRPWIGY